MSNEINNITSITAEEILAMKEKLEEGEIELMIDLEGDDIADPNHDDASYESSYAQVVGAVRETPECIVIHFEGMSSVGFPTNHVLTVGNFSE